MAPYFDLAAHPIVPDPELVRRVPFDLECYYLALPLAREDGKVSVLMAHPHNTTALAVLRNVLQEEVVPIAASPEAIQATLARLHLEQSPTPRLLVWMPHDQGEANRQAVQVWVDRIGRARQAAPTWLSAPATSLAEAIQIARQGAFALTIVQTPPLAEADRTAWHTDLLRRAATPLLLVRGEYQTPPPLKRILIVMRGFASDLRELAWMAPLAQQEGALLTLLPLQAHSSRNAASEPDHLVAVRDLPLPDVHGRGNGRGNDADASVQAEHWTQCLRQLQIEEDAEHAPRLRFRQGSPRQQVAAEAEEGEYDLIVIAAEGSGTFVASVLRAIDQRQAHRDRPILILKSCSTLPPSSDLR